MAILAVRAPRRGPCRRPANPAAERCHCSWQPAEHGRRFGLHRIAAGCRTAKNNVAESKEDCPLSETKCTAIDGFPSGVDVHLGDNSCIREIGQWGDIKSFTGQLLQVCLKIVYELRLGRIRSGCIRRLDHFHGEHVRGLGAIGAGLPAAGEGTFRTRPEGSTGEG